MRAARKAAQRYLLVIATSVRVVHLPIYAAGGRTTHAAATVAEGSLSRSLTVLPEATHLGFDGDEEAFCRGQHRRARV